MTNKRIALTALIVVVALMTLFVRIPLPTRGYFNVGDVAVVFAGLVLGSLAKEKGFWWGAAAGGIGSALADILGGYAMFAPVTLIAKGIEGGLAALAAKQARARHFILLGLGGALMVAAYFIAETLVPAYGGLQAAVPELVPNLIQAVGGLVGGRLTFEAYQRIVQGVTQKSEA
jgi:uncharacterized membrane protein